MKNKRRSMIKKFLVQEYGKQKSVLILRKQELIFQTLSEQAAGKSKTQKKTLRQTILPVTALYLALLEFEPEKNRALYVARKFMTDIVAAGKRMSMLKMEKIPGFFYLYKSIFLKVMRTSDLWESIQKSEKDCYDITITKCLWHETCFECGCPELCQLFCDADNITYGGLHKIGFNRTQALGHGGDFCDFHFFKKNS